jgi:hypothetical protein
LLGALPGVGDRAFPVRRRRRLQPRSGTLRHGGELLLRDLHGRAERYRALRPDARSDDAASDAEEVRRARRSLREVVGLLRE